MIALQNHEQSILVVDDDPDVRDVVSKALRDAGFSVLTEGSAGSIDDLLETQTIDLVILDVMMPGSDGFSVARSLTNRYSVPIVFLTGKAGVVDKVVGLELGAEDYITKPFHNEELVARVRTVLRRSERKEVVPDADYRVAIVHGWTFDLERQEILSEDGEKITLTDYENRLLKHFVTRPGRVVSRDQILELLGKKGDLPFDRSVDVLISRLRKKLSDIDRRIIVSVRNSGYKFSESVSWAPRDSA